MKQEAIDKIDNKIADECNVGSQEFLLRKRWAIFGYNLAMIHESHSGEQQPVTGEVEQSIKDKIESYVYKWPPEIQETMRRDILFGYSLSPTLDLLIQANDVLRSCYQVAERSGAKTNWEGLTPKIKTVLEKIHKAIYMPASQPPTPEPAGELYWKQLAEVSGKLVEYLKVEAERYFTNDYKKYKELKNQKPEPQQNQDE